MGSQVGVGLDPEAEEEVGGWESAAREAILRLLKAAFIQGSLGGCSVTRALAQQARTRFQVQCCVKV